MESLNSGWEYIPEWSEAFARGEGTAETVRLPHTCGEVPLHYASPDRYARVCGYRRYLFVPGELRGRRLFLQFDGAGHIATVFCNGRELYTHRCGYTAFRVEITGAVTFGGNNRICVRLDATENPSVPPFGHVIDYLTYGGLYREVWLDIRPETYIEDVFVTTPLLSRAEVRLTFSDGAEHRCRVTLLDSGGNVCCVRERNRNIIYVNYAAGRKRGDGR